jgi:Uma2 family endonuclease
LHRQLANFLKGKSCKVFVAPFDVCLTGLGDDDTTVVQPDVLVICDKSKLVDGKRCNGAPDMAIEVLSPSTMRRDLFLKLNKYKVAGVREYWIVSHDEKAVNVHILINGQYIINTYGHDDTIPVSILDGCDIALSDVFDF